MGSPYEGADALLDDVDHDHTDGCPCGADHDAGLGERFYQMANMLGPDFPLVREALNEFCVKQGIDPASLDGITDIATWQSIIMDAALPNVTPHVDWANNPAATAASKWVAHRMLTSLKVIFSYCQAISDLGLRLHPHHVSLLDEASSGFQNAISQMLALQSNPLHATDTDLVEQQATSDVPQVDGKEAATIIPAHEGAFTAWFDEYMAETDRIIERFEADLNAAEGNAEAIDPTPYEGARQAAIDAAKAKTLT